MRSAFSAHSLVIFGLVITQFTNVVGSVYLKIALSAPIPPNPIIFALYREILSGFILTAVSAWFHPGFMTTEALPVAPLATLGICLFANQLLFILGLSLAGVALATCMQPSIPIFTVFFGMMLQLEKASVKRIVGTALAATGATSMLYGSTLTSPDSSLPTTDVHHRELLPLQFLGGLCLIGNCVAMSLYFITARAMPSGYPAFCMTAAAYVTAACWMALAALFAAPSSAWLLPASAHGPLLFWVLGPSVGGYSILTAATKYLPASNVAAFICLQPLVGSLFAGLALGERLTAWDCGAGLIVGGLFMVLFEHSQHGGAAGIGSAVGLGAGKETLEL